MSVKLVGLGRALPTFSFGFLKSFFLSLFFFALDPIVAQGGRGSRSGRWLYAVAVAVDRVVQRWFDMQENMLNCVACESLIFLWVPCFGSRLAYSAGSSEQANAPGARVYIEVLQRETTLKRLVLRHLFSIESSPEQIVALRGNMMTETLVQNPCS